MLKHSSVEEIFKDLVLNTASFGLDSLARSLNTFHRVVPNELEAVFNQLSTEGNLSTRALYDKLQEDWRVHLIAVQIFHPQD